MLKSLEDTKLNLDDYNGGAIKKNSFQNYK